MKYFTKSFYITNKGINLYWLDTVKLAVLLNLNNAIWKLEHRNCFLFKSISDNKGESNKVNLFLSSPWFEQTEPSYRFRTIKVYKQHYSEVSVSFFTVVSRIFFWNVERYFCLCFKRIFICSLPNLALYSCCHRFIRAETDHMCCLEVPSYFHLCS